MANYTKKTWKEAPDTSTPLNAANLGGDISLNHQTIGNRVEGSVIGLNSSAQGINVIASGEASHAEGDTTVASNQNAHAEGRGSKATGNAGSHAEGFWTEAQGGSSHSEGDHTIAKGIASHAEGANTIAEKPYSHAEGRATKATGDSSHSEGDGTLASGNYSHAEGNATTASGTAAHSEGSETKAVGWHSHAEGYLSEANGFISHAGGFNTRAQGDYQTAIGKFNEPNTTDLFQVGMGTSEAARKNAFRVTADGDIMNGYGDTLHTPEVQFATSAECEAYYNTVSNVYTKNNTHYTRTVVHNGGHPVLQGGSYFLEGFKADSEYEWQKATSYSDVGVRHYVRSKYANVWKPWVAK